MVDYMKKQYNVYKFMFIQVFTTFKGQFKDLWINNLIIEIFDIGGNSFDEI